MANILHWNNANKANLMELECVPGFNPGSWTVSELRSAETNNLKNFYDPLEMNLLRKWNCNEIRTHLSLRANMIRFEFRFSGFCH
jgi:hypothetical protein